MIVKLMNGTELSPLVILGDRTYYQGISRRTLSFVFKGDIFLDYLDEVFTPENCEIVTLIDEKHRDKQFLHEGYTIRVSIEKKSVEISPSTAISKAQFEDRIIVTMAERTYEESQLLQLQSAISLIQEEQ